MREATRLIRERLADMDPLTLGLLSKDIEMRHRFLREVVGYLYNDFRCWVQFDANFGSIPTSTSVVAWRPPDQRPALPEAGVSDDAYDE
jgi:hypothetical protein